MRYLIVDDDAATREYLRELLSATGKCDAAHSGWQAMEMTRQAFTEQQPYDLLVVDSALPEGESARLVESVRAWEKEHSVPRSVSMILLGASWAASGRAAQPAGASAAFDRPRPIDENLFLQTVRSLVPSPSAAQPASSPPPRSSAKSASSPRPAVAAPETPVQRRRALIVDDDRLCRVLMREYLAPVADCDEVVNGQEALQAVRMALDEGSKYDLVTLDIMMPGLDGHAVLEQIRKLEEAHGVFALRGAKIIMTTALGDAKNIVRAFREGCESYITKPVDEDKLFSKLQETGFFAPQPV